MIGGEDNPRDFADEDKNRSDFELEEEAFDRFARIRALDNAALLSAHRSLSQSRIITRSLSLALVEAEIVRRGLSLPN